MSRILKESVRVVEEDNRAAIFGYHVVDPERYGVIEFDKDNNIVSLEVSLWTAKH